MIRGVRGATTAAANDRDAIFARTDELLKTIVADNGIATADISAAIFSSTPDLDAAFPAAAARALGWTEVPLFGAQEIDSPTGVPRCIRVLILWNTDKSQAEIRHVYLHEAAALRQDIAR